MDTKPGIMLPNDRYDVRVQEDDAGWEFGAVVVMTQPSLAPIAVLRYDPPTAWRPTRGPRLVVLGSDEKTVGEMTDLLVAVHFLRTIAQAYSESFPSALVVVWPDGRVKPLYKGNDA